MDEMDTTYSLACRPTLHIWNPW